jgi:hypothetical protein
MALDLYDGYASTLISFLFPSQEIDGVLFVLYVFDEYGGRGAPI